MVAAIHVYNYTKIQGSQFQRNYIIARDQKSDLHGTSFQSSPQINRMLTTRPSCIFSGVISSLSLESISNPWDINNSMLSMFPFFAAAWSTLQSLTLHSASEAQSSESDGTVLLRNAAETLCPRTILRNRYECQREIHWILIYFKDNEVHSFNWFSQMVSRLVSSD